jgi:hypothetical protein
MRGKQEHLGAFRSECLDRLAAQLGATPLRLALPALSIEQIALRNAQCLLRLIEAIV